jgi:hypothetical protein
MPIQTFTTGQVLTAAQMNTLQTTVATYNGIGRRDTALTLTSSSNSQRVDSTNFQKTITATAGDLIQATWNSYIDAGSNIVHFNFYTFNGATAVNPFCAPSSFNPFFVETARSGVECFVSLYQCVAGDIFSGQITVALTGNSAGTARNVVNAAVPAGFSLTNLGKVQ